MSIREDDLNKLNIYKGKINGNRFPIWDAVPLCTKECPLRSECSYDKDIEKKCKLQVIYLRSALDITLSNLPDEKPTEYILSKIGLNLLPLYKQLITMKMLEHSLKSPEVGKGGKVKIHPVYKEIRQISKDIDAVLKGLGLDGTPLKPILPSAPSFVPTKENVHGSKGYYEEMQKVHENKRDKKNKKAKAKRSQI